MNREGEGCLSPTSPASRGIAEIGKEGGVPGSGDPVIGESGDRKINPAAEGGCAPRSSLNPAPIWDDLGCCGMNGEGEGCLSPTSPASRGIAEIGKAKTLPRINAGIG